MDAMMILKRCRTAGNDIARIEMRIRQRWEILTAIGAPQADPNGGGRRSGGDADRNGRVMADIDLLERQKQARQEEYEAEKVAALALLDMVPELENEVLFLYYLKGKDTTEIARKKNYTAGYVRKTKRNGEMLLGMLAQERVDGTLPDWYLKRRGDED